MIAEYQIVADSSTYSSVAAPITIGGSVGGLLALR
jgi:hypothetical protein